MATVAGACIAAAVLVRRANRLPPGERATSTTPRAPCVSQLAQGVAAQTAQHPSLSGLSLLKDGVDAFAARLLLMRAAEPRLDLQYYIWHGDRTGTLMLEALHAAADRGLQIRLLLDDNGIAGLDRVLSALDGHPNIAVRLFNPFRIRFPKSIGYLVDFGRLNRRMHNKSFTAATSISAQATVRCSPISTFWRSALRWTKWSRISNATGAPLLPIPPRKSCRRSASGSWTGCSRGVRW
ncbi:hypothetical protein [Sphingobium sp.]|uniref:hypothetical protein n=1 Tax=Sphingobium sp. TaxID=1912891 RepID=UPI002C2D8B9E|nr:hypothetical protein [Sphingobium sp.]HUD94724.1 hypothetical protein [Sphingobium sp.]